MEEVILRPVESGDLVLVLELMRGLYDCDQIPFDAARAIRALAELQTDPSQGSAWLVEQGGAAVGYAVLTFGFSLEFGGRYALLDELFILAEHRSRGVGRQVLARLERTCRDLGLLALRLEVGRMNHAARRLYERAGFELHDRDLMTLWMESVRRKAASGGTFG
jgi:GNAT superfamily N-acetyltransferase